MKDDKQMKKATAKFTPARQRLDNEYRKILPEMLRKDAHRNKATPPDAALLTVQQLATAEAAGLTEWKARAKIFTEASNNAHLDEELMFGKNAGKHDQRTSKKPSGRHLKRVWVRFHTQFFSAIVRSLCADFR